MTNEEMKMVAEKIKTGTATQEEILSFVKGYNDILDGLNNDLK